MDIGGNVQNLFAYDAYGTLIASNASPQTMYLYAGQQFDQTLGLYFNRARYLNAGTGRFWTMDTYAGDNEDPLSLHKYLYCQGNPINGIDPSGHDGDMGSLMSTITTIGYMAANIGLRAAPALTRVTVVIFEATTGESVAIGGGAAITGYAAMSRVEGGIGSWTTAVSKLQGVTFGPFSYVRSLIRGTTGNANHLNQTAAFPAIIRKAAGCVELDGNPLVTGTEHNQFHQVLEQFWDQFRRTDKIPTNKQYLTALRSGLSSIVDGSTKLKKFTDDEVNAMVDFAEQEQIGYGYFDGPGGMPPRVPGSMNLDYGN